MKTKLVVAMLLAGSSLFAGTHFSIGIGVGGYGYAAPPVVAYAPPYPGPGYTWGNGYWVAPAYRSGYQAVSPFDRDRYEGRRYRVTETRGQFNNRFGRR